MLINLKCTADLYLCFLLDKKILFFLYTMMCISYLVPNIKSTKSFSLDGYETKLDILLLEMHILYVHVFAGHWQNDANTCISYYI